MNSAVDIAIHLPLFIPMLLLFFAAYRIASISDEMRRQRKGRDD